MAAAPIPRRTFVVRRAIATIHRWTGLTLGALLVFVALTGALVGYRAVLESTIDRALLVVPACASARPLDEIMAASRAAHPSGALDLVRLFPVTSGVDAQTVQVRYRDAGNVDVVYVDPCTARVVGSRPRWSGVFATLEQLHRFRFVPGADGLTGVVALTFICILFTFGLYLWWPRSRAGWKRAARFDPRVSGRARHLDRHRVVGLYVSGIVLVSALTGLPQAFDWAEGLLHRVAGSHPDPRPRMQGPGDGSRASYEVLLDNALLTMTEPVDVSMRFASGKDAKPVQVSLLERSAPHAEAKAIVDLDPRDGKVLRAMRFDERSAGDRLHAWLLAWHTGELGGLVGPLVLTTGALGVAFLFYSGFSSYLGRRRKVAAGAATTPIGRQPS